MPHLNNLASYLRLQLASTLAARWTVRTPTWSLQVSGYEQKSITAQFSCGPVQTSSSYSNPNIAIGKRKRPFRKVRLICSAYTANIFRNMWSKSANQQNAGKRSPKDNVLYSANTAHRFSTLAGDLHRHLSAN